jgi:ribosome maturation factor RimP
MKERAMSASQAKALRSLAEPIVAAADCDLEDVVIRQAGKRRLVRIVVDHRGGGLTLDLVATISREIGRALDDSTLLGNSAYVLEVTSPGVDRPLTLPRHWTRAIGRLVRVTPLSGAAFEGRVLSADEAHAVLDIGGTEATVAYSEVSRAVVQVEFTRLEEAELNEAEDDPDADPDDEGYDSGDDPDDEADHDDSGGRDSTDDPAHASTTDPEEG